jgi:hypothetical protein
LFFKGDPANSSQPEGVELPLGPRGITQLLLGRLIFVFEGKFVEIGLVAILLVDLVSGWKRRRIQPEPTDLVF